jgi:hypothetical protein
MKKFSIFLAVFAFFAMTAVSFAANTANISVTSEPIKEHAACDKAGGFAITWDTGSVFNSGDQITFDLPLNVYLCKTIDMVAGVDVGTGDASGFNNDLPSLGATTSPLTATAGSNISTVNGGVTFWIHGASNSSRVTIDIMGDSDGDGSQDSLQPVGVTPSMTFTQTAPGDVIELAFLDQVVYGAGSWGIFNEDADFAGTYSDPVELADNTLCINVEAYDAETVNASFDSKGDKYTWIPSNPQVAHVVAGNSVVAYDCDKQAKGYITLPTAAGQGGSTTCYAIDNEAGNGITTAAASYAATTDGFCASTHRRNKFIVRTSDGNAFDSADYDLELTILVNGAAGDNGVYFTTDTVGSEGYDTAADACDDTSASANTGTHKYYNASDGELTAMGATDTDCTIASTDKAVKMTVSATDLNLNQTTNDYAWIDLPEMVIDSALFQEGDVLSVRLVINKSPCGEIFDGTLEIGTAGCQAATSTDTLTFPYVGKTIGGAYVSAVVVDNLTGNAGTVSFTMYEQDGDIFTSDAIAIPAYGMLVQATTSATFNWALSATSTGSGVAGDSKAFIMAVGTVSSIDGCALITNATTGESISYLPRQ